MRKTDFARILERKLRLHDKESLPNHSHQSGEILNESMIFNFKAPNLEGLLQSKKKYPRGSPIKDAHSGPHFVQEKKEVPLREVITPQTRPADQQIQIQTQTPRPKLEPRLYIQNVNGSTYIAWIQLRKLGTTHFQMDSLSPSEAKKAYRQLALKLHPDLGSSQHTDRFMTLKAAYAIMECSFRELI